MPQGLVADRTTLEPPSCRRPQQQRCHEWGPHLHNDVGGVERDALEGAPKDLLCAGGVARLRMQHTPCEGEEALSPAAVPCRSTTHPPAAGCR